MLRYALAYAERGVSAYPLDEIDVNLSRWIRMQLLRGCIERYGVDNGTITFGVARFPVAVISTEYTKTDGLSVSVFFSFFLSFQSPLLLVAY